MNKNKFEIDMELKDYKVRFNTLVDKYKLNNLQSGTAVSTPMNGEVLGHFTEEHNDTLQQHVDLSKEAFAKWKVYPAPKRGEMMRQFGNAIREAKEDLSTMITLENGKVFQESMGEIQEVIDICDFAVGLSRQLYGLTMPSEREDHRMQEIWNPYGVVGVVSAFNFPAAVWSWNFAIAGVGGNVTVWKPSPKTPFISMMLKKIWDNTCEQNDLAWAKDVLRLYMGSNSQAVALCTHSDVKVVSLTGSSAMGKELGPIVTKRFGKLIMELGGNNAMIVTPEANLKLALKSILFSAVGTAGQRCTTLRRLIVHNSVYDVLLQKLKSAYASLPVGDNFKEETLVGPLINQESADRMQSVLQKAKEKGYTVHGGEVVEGCTVRPAIVEASEQCDLVKTETFAPILYVLKYNDLEEAISIHNAVPQGLSSCIFTDNVQEAETFTSAVGSDCGIVNINIGPSGAEIGGAFGGEKDTGGGRESGSDAWKQYMRRSTVTINYGKSLPLAQGIKFGD